MVERALTKVQKRRLMRYECAWCGQRLDRPYCGAIYERCDAATRQKRREDCLAEGSPKDQPQ